MNRHCVFFFALQLLIVHTIKAQKINFQFDHAGKLVKTIYPNQTIQTYNLDEDKNRVGKLALSCSASISPSGSTSFCTSNSVTLYASYGSSYLWSNGSTNSSIVVNQSGTYSVTVTDANGCIAHATPITVTVYPSVTPDNSIVVDTSGIICSNTVVTYTSIHSNEGTNPVFQWMKNGIAVGVNNSQFTDSVHNQNDSVYCILTSNDPCAVPQTVTSNTITLSITPSVLPVISVSSSLNSICVNTPVVFTSIYQNGGLNPQFQWLKNNNIVGTNSSYVDSNLASSDSIKCIMVSNADCALPQAVNSNSLFINVNQLTVPTISIIATDTLINIGNGVTFTAIGNNVGSSPQYNWMKNGVPVGSNSNQYATTSLSNNDLISCELVNNDSCVSPHNVTSNTIHMTVTNNCTASITVNGLTTFCNGGSTTLAASQGITYLWSNGATTQSIVVNQSGNYTVTTTNNYGCVATSQTVPIIVKPMPSSIKIKALTSVTVCEPNGVLFAIDSTTGNVSGFLYQWKINGTPIIGATDSIFNANQSGAVSLNVTGGSNCIKNSTAKNATIKPLPTATFSAVGATEICTGGSVTLTAPTISGYTYTWLKDGLGIGSGNTKVVKLQGDYSVVAKLNSCVDTSDNILPVIVHPLPIASLFTNDPLSFCVGDSAILHALPIGNGYSYQWKSGSNIIIGETNATYTAKVASTYKVISIDSFGCVSKLSSTSIKITTQPIPLPVITPVGSTTISQGGSVKLKASPTTSGNLYQWFLNGTAITGATLKEYIATQIGSYTVNITKGICTGSSSSTLVTIASIKGVSSTAYQKDESEFEVKAFPNPVSGELRVEVFGNKTDNATIKLFDINSKLITTKSITQNSVTIDMSKVASGIYFVQFLDGNKSRTIKVTKE